MGRKESSQTNKQFYMQLLSSWTGWFVLLGQKPELSAFLKSGQRPVEFGQKAFESSKLGNFTQCTVFMFVNIWFRFYSNTVSKGMH